MHVGGITMDLNWLLQFIFTVFVLGLGLLHLVKNAASKYFEAAESNHTVIDPCIVFRCVNCGSFGTKRCSRCKSVKYCSLGCQIKHWNAGHKLKCKDFGASSSGTAKSNSKPLIEKPGVTNPNFWEDPVRGTDSHNGWGAAVASTHSAAGGGGWMDEAPREDDNGWGAAVIDPSIGNQAMEAEEDSFRCVNCGNSGSKTCSRCKSVRYCSLGCQKKHWKAGHRLKCKDFGASSSRTAKSNSKPIIEKPGVTNPNFWEDPVRGTDSHNGWGAAVASTHSAAGGGGWMDEAPREDDNGWGAAVASTHSAAGGGGWMNEAPREDDNGWGAAVASTHSAAGGGGWMDEAPREDDNGWGATVASTHSAAGGGGWMDEAPREDYNGWGVPNMGPSGSQGHVFETSSGNTSSAPSAPPIPDGAFDEEPIHHPSIDFSPLDSSVPAIERGASVTSDHVNEGGTSSCIICWEAPVEGACIPCGHMAGCMACLSEIKAKKGVCPVCRSNINQVLRLYAV